MVILVLGTQSGGQHKFKISLVYTMSSRLARAICETHPSVSHIHANNKIKDEGEKNRKLKIVNQDEELNLLTPPLRLSDSREVNILSLSSLVKLCHTSQAHFWAWLGVCTEKGIKD